MSVWYDRDDPANNDPPDYDDRDEPPEQTRAEAQRERDEHLVSLRHLPVDKLDLWRAAYATQGMNLDVLIADARARLAARERPTAEEHAIVDCIPCDGRGFVPEPQDTGNPWRICDWCAGEGKRTVRVRG